MNNQGFAFASSEDYGGMYVAQPDFENPKVIACGADPRKVTQEAKDKGFAEPVVYFVPAKDTVQIY